MTEAPHTAQAAVENTPSHAPTPWRVTHGKESSTIEAYVKATERWEMIGTIRQAEHIDHKANADFIVRAVNDDEKHKALIAEMLYALELCLECEGLSWAAEFDAHIVVERAKQGSP